MKARFQVKDHVQPIFKKKRNVPFAALEQIDEELDRLEKAGILSKRFQRVGCANSLCEEKKLIKLGFAPIFHRGWTKH